MIDLILLLPWVVGIGALIWITRLPRDVIRPLHRPIRQNVDWWCLLILAQGIALLSILGGNDRGEGVWEIAGFFSIILGGHWWACTRHLTRAGVRESGSRVVFTLILMPVTLIVLAALIANTIAPLDRFVNRTAADLWPNDYQHRGIGAAPAAQQVGILLGIAVSGVVLIVALRAAHLIFLDYAAELKSDGANPPPST